MTTPAVDLDDQEAPSGLRALIDEANRDKAAAVARAAAAERELAFAKAGLDLADPKMQYFVRGYDGDPDPEKIKAAALEAGFLTPAEPQVSAAELAQHQAAANFSAGAGADARDPNKPLWRDNPEYDALMVAATSKEQVKQIMRDHGSPLDDDLD